MRYSGAKRGKPEDLADPARSAEAAGVIADIVAVEAPVHRSVVYRLLADAYRVGPLGARVKSRIEDLLDLATADGRVVLVGEFLWRKGDDPETYDLVRAPLPREEPRDVETVATEELAASALRVLRASVALPEADLARAAALPFGWRRVTVRMREAFSVAIDLLVRRAVARRDGDTVRLP